MLSQFRKHDIVLPSDASGQKVVLCPKCSQSRKKSKVPCLSVNVEEGVWNCHHCGWSGTVKTGGYHPDELHWRKPPYRKPEPRTVANLPEATVKWFETRGITRSVLERNKVCAADVYMPQQEKWLTALMFPYHRGGELVNAKYRDSQKNFRMEAGAERILYGFDDINPGCTVIVEGEMDKLACEVAGFRNCVSVPDGAPNPNANAYQAKFTFLDDPRVQEVEKWVIAVDTDSAGKVLEQELVRRFGRDKCFVVNYPEGCKDANEVLQYHGAVALANMLDKPKPYPLEGVVPVADLREELLALYDHGRDRGVPTGWGNLDEFYTVRPGELTVVTGVPNSGKSNWVDCLLVNLAKIHGWSFGLFSPENQPVVDHISRVIEKVADMPFREGPTRRMSREDAAYCHDWVERYFHWILPSEDSNWTVDSILETARGLVRRHGIRGLVIDPWNQLEGYRPPGMTETEYIGHSIKKIHQFAKSNGVHVWVVVHPAKMSRDQNGKYPVPTLYDCHGSAHWRNMPDNGIVVWRDLASPEEKLVQLHIQKIRFTHLVGKIGMCSLEYTPPSGCYKIPRIPSSLDVITE